MQVEHAGTRESRLMRQKEGGGGEEEGIINRKLSIPQHLRDRGIAVIRPRGRKLAGLWERKPRLEEAAEESEMEDCYCIQASVGQRRGGERGRKRSTHGEPGERSRRACEDQTAGLHQGTSAPLAMLQDEGSCPTCCRGRLEQHLWVDASPSASCEPPSHLIPSCSIAFSRGSSLAQPYLQVGISQRPGL